MSRNKTITQCVILPSEYKLSPWAVSNSLEYMHFIHGVWYKIRSIRDHYLFSNIISLYLRKRMLLLWYSQCLHNMIMNHRQFTRPSRSHINHFRATRVHIRILDIFISVPVSVYNNAGPSTKTMRTASNNHAVCGFWLPQTHSCWILYHNWRGCVGHHNLSCHDVYNARIAETYLATANYVWPAAVDTLPLVKT